MGFSGGVQVSSQDVRTTSTDKKQTLGTIGLTRDGKVYRYAQAGAVALSPGKICVNPDVDTNVVNKTVAATVAAGDLERKVVIDAAGAITGDAYVDGTLTINDATGEGINYAVAGNSSTSGAAELSVYLKEPTLVALTVDVSEATLAKNQWDDIVISIADQADMCVGAPNVSFAAGAYGWVQTGGDCSVLWDEAVAKGLALTIGTSTVGAVEALDGAGEVQIGVASQAGVDTEYQTAFLTIY